MRAATTLLSLTGLYLGFLGAPFLHIHTEEADHPASSPAHLHVHLASKTAGLALIARTADDDAIDLEWRIAPPSAPAFIVDLAIAEAATITAPAVLSAAVPIPQPRAHDPPRLKPAQPRAPPA